MRIFWTGPALSDLRALHTDIAKDGEGAANALIARVVDRAERQLCRLPESGRSLPSLPRSRTREGRGKARELVISGTPYVLAYRIVGDTIHVLRVFHSARRWP